MNVLRACARSAAPLRRARWASAKADAKQGGGGGGGGAGEGGERKKVGFIYLLLPMGFIVYSISDDLRTIYGRATAPWDVLDVAADVSNQIAKYGCGPLFVRLAWRTFASYDVQDPDRPCLAGSLAEPGSFVAKLPANRGLDRGIELLKGIKEKHPGVSWPDLIALAGCVAVEDMGGPRVTFNVGRPETGPTDLDIPQLLARTPDHSKGVGHLKNVFYRMGFGRGELVALMGAHGLGGVHKQFTGVDAVRSTTPYVFDNSYYLDLLDSDWAPEPRNGQTVYTGTHGIDMLPIDVALLKDPELHRYVVAYSMDEPKFHAAFASAFQKLLELGYANAGLRRTSWRGVNTSEI